ncbi:hypothetical protein [Actinophytocola sp.]|uniref:hypothetical protein n=1 Tax=Actinophytocola sp. TaxID=1872138 RepID=UPI002ED5F8EA
MTPQRVLDTRDGRGAVGPGGTVTVDLSALTPATTTSVVLNVTGTEPTAATFVTVYPSDEPKPETSNLNLVPRQTRANSATVVLSADRRVTLHNFAGNTHLVVDLVGYYATDKGSGFEPATPLRVLDTRVGAPVGPGGVVDVQLDMETWKRPSAVVLNVTAVNATTNTFVTAYTAGQPAPSTSNLNLGPNEAVPNQVIVPLDENKKFSLRNKFGNVHLVVDVMGYYSDFGWDFVAMSPIRWIDTRPYHSGPQGGTAGVYFYGFGYGRGVEAVAANLTGTNATASQYVVAWPGGSNRPNASQLNVVPGQTVANAVTVGVNYEPTAGYDTVNVANNAGYVDLIFDIAGYFRP